MAAPAWSDSIRVGAAMNRPLVAIVVSLVIALLVLGGAGLLVWVAGADRSLAAEQAKRESEAATAALRALAGDLVADSAVWVEASSAGAQRRLRTWLEQEPLGLHRDAADPGRIDMDSLVRDLVARVRTTAREESERVGILADRLASAGDARIEAAVGSLRAASEERASEGSRVRRGRLALHLGWLLLLLGTGLAWVLWSQVVRPLANTQEAVDRVARGDLDHVIPPAGGAREIRLLAGDVERMRMRLRELSAGLEVEVRRKTAEIEHTLAQRTEALAELERARDQLVQSAKMAGLGTLAGGMAHEFNNLLGGILGCLESAAGEEIPAAAREDLDVARRTALRASSLVTALLDVARPGERKFEPVDLAALADDVVRAAEPTARRAEVRLERERSGRAWTRGDAGQLHQVVLNLVTNAFDHVGRGGRVVVATSATGREALLEVRDNGPGVPHELRDRIFEPFFTTRPAGTGLGLFISFGIVERHGGRIEVGDAAEGGASFLVALPLA